MFFFSHFSCRHENHSLPEFLISSWKLPRDFSPENPPPTWQTQTFPRPLAKTGCLPNINSIIRAEFTYLLIPYPPNSPIRRTQYIFINTHLHEHNHFYAKNEFALFMQQTKFLYKSLSHQIPQHPTVICVAHCFTVWTLT